MNPLATPTRIALLGDIHGNLGHGRRALEYARNERGADVAIALGDFGYWGPDLYLNGMSITACQLKLPILVVDGNHEDHAQLDAIPLDPDTGLRPLAEGVWHLPRGYRWTWSGVDFLALGGATSVDRRQRTPGCNWFPQERITWTQAQAAMDAGPADVMLTHDAPDGVVIPGLDSEAWRWPNEELATAADHRRTLRLVVDQVRPRWLFHGHYHAAHTQLLDETRNYRCVVQGVAHHGARTLSQSVVVKPLRHMALTEEVTQR